MKEQNSLRKTPGALLAVSALSAAVAGGYILHGAPTTAQAVDPNASTKTPVVATAATGDAVSMQHAFNQVSRAIEPAVVTITTEGPTRTASAGRGGASPDGGGADPFGGDLGEFFRHFGGRSQGKGGDAQPDDGPNAEPNSFSFGLNRAEKAKLRGLWHEAQERSGGLGSGMIYRPDGYIITNAHVVQDAQTVSVKLNDGREFRHARVVGRDERSDIAVVKVDANRLPTVRLSDSSAVNVGDWAIAVGNPFGLEHTLTVGVISAKAREVPLSERGASDYLQTDASINPGNSGGPLCDIYGRVIGVNNAIYSQSGGNVGIGFAIPSNTAKEIADKLVTSGRIVRGYLGVKIGNVDTAESAAGLDLPVGTRGVLIDEVTDEKGPGARAGLQAGDVVTKFNGQPVSRSIDLQRMVGDAAVGSTITLTVIRNGQTQDLRATLAELKDGAPSASRPDAAPAPEEKVAPSALGLSLRALTPPLAQQFRMKAGTRGVVVVGVQDGSPAANAGLRRGDVIESVGQTPVASPTDYQSAVNRLLARQQAGDKTVALRVNRAGQKTFVFVTVE